MGGVHGRVQSLAYHRRFGGACRRRLAITGCCDGLQQLPHEYSCYYFISFQTWFHVKVKHRNALKFFKIILFHFRRGSMLK